MWRQAVVVLCCTAAVALAETFTSTGGGKVEGGSVESKPAEVTGSKPTAPGHTRNCWHGLCQQQCSDSTGPHYDGQTWIGENRWKYLCTRGSISIIACIADRRANHVEIPVNQQVTVGGFWYKCERKGGNILYSIEPRCTIFGQTMKIGATIVVQQHFKVQCTETGLPVVACVIDAGGHRREIPIGQSAVVGARTWRCSRMGGGGAQLSSEASGCVVNGQTRAIGAVWLDGSFKRRCTQSGSHDIIACIAQGREIAMGQSAVIGTVQWSCTKDHGGHVRLTPKTIGCSFRGQSKQPGEVWVYKGSYKLRCNDNGHPGVIACIRGHTEIAVGQSAVIGTTEWHCTKESDGVHLKAKSVGCSVGGQTRRLGEEWVDGRIKMKCTDRGTGPIGCVLDNGTYLEAGTSRIINHYLHSCYRQWDGSVRYSAYPYESGHSVPYRRYK